MTGRPGLASPPMAPDPAAGGVRVETCWLDDDRDIALAAAWAILAPGEAERARRFRFPRDRDRHVRGRGFLRRTLSRETGRPAAGLVLVEGPRGKPALAGGGPQFNLSHSGSLAALAIGGDGPVGIDLELSNRTVNIEGLATACFTPAECAVLDALPAAARRTRFFAFWTAKEARMKLTGEGMALAPLAIALDLRAGWPAGCRLPEVPAVRLAYPDLDHPGAVCCVATLDRGSETGRP